MRIKPPTTSTKAETAAATETRVPSAPSQSTDAASDAVPAGPPDAAVFERSVQRNSAVADAAASASPQAVAERFYDAFVNRRFDDMRSLYAEGVTFKDDVFRYGDRDGTMGMWQKLLADPDNVKASYRFERVEGNVAIGRWQADYEIFGRKVHNDIESRLTIVDGKIVDHKDDFDFAKWARQALPIGPLAKLPGVKGLVTGAIRLFAG